MSHLVTAAAVVLWSVCLLRLVELRRGAWTPLRTWTWWAFCFLAVAATWLSPVGSWSLTGVGVSAAWADLFGRLAILGAAACSRRLIPLIMGSSAAEPGRSGRQGWIVIGAVGLVVAFAGALRSQTRQLGSDAQPGWWVTAYLLVFVGVLIVVILGNLSMAQRLIRSSPRPELVQGMRIFALGNVLGLAYLVVKLGAQAAVLLAQPVGAVVEHGVGQGLAAAAGVCIAVGATWPTLSRHGAQVTQYVRDYRMNAALYPLWRALTLRHPEIALEGAVARWRDACRLRHQRLRLYRRVIEIDDGLRLYPARHEPGLVNSRRRDGERRGLQGSSLTAFVEARCLMAAMTTPGAAAPVAVAVPTRDATVDSEAAWLKEVSGFFGGSPRRRGVGRRTGPVRLEVSA